MSMFKVTVKLPEQSKKRHSPTDCDLLHPNVDLWNKPDESQSKSVYFSSPLH